MKNNLQGNAQTPSLTHALASASKLHATLNTQARAQKSEVTLSIPATVTTTTAGSAWSEQFLAQSTAQTQHARGPMGNPGFMPAFFPRYPTFSPSVELSQKSGAAERAATTEQDISAARRLSERLHAEPDFSESEFLRFVDRLTEGAVKFSEGGRVVDASGEDVELDDLLDTPPDNYESSIDRIFREMAAEDPEVLGNHHRAAGDALYRPPNELDYTFNSRNRYLEAEGDLVALADTLKGAGKVDEAIEALESHLRTKDKEDGEVWRRLGTLHASRDEDNIAIKCFQKAHALDPYDSDCLLSLGVALTNELDGFRALDTLRLWLKSREEYFTLFTGTSAIDPGVTGPLDYLHEGNLRQDMLVALNKAAQVNPSDPDVHTALGVVNNWNKDFKTATINFANSCALKADDASLWNKLGATLANGGESEMALHAYAHALALEPGYVRGWSNLGIAYLNMQKPETAVQAFVKGLLIHPNADNLWSTLFLTCTNFLADNEALGQAAVGKNLHDVLKHIKPLEISPPAGTVQETIQSIRSRLGQTL